MSLTTDNSADDVKYYITGREGIVWVGFDGVTEGEAINMLDTMLSVAGIPCGLFHKGSPDPIKEVIK